MLRYAKWPHSQGGVCRAAILHNAALCYLALPHFPLEGDAQGEIDKDMKAVGFAALMYLAVR